jgi:hypothetical protein
MHSNTCPSTTVDITGAAAVTEPLVKSRETDCVCPATYITICFELEAVVMRCTPDGAVGAYTFVPSVEMNMFPAGYTTCVEEPAACTVANCPVEFTIW